MKFNLLVLRCRDLSGCRAFYETIGFGFVEHSHGAGPLHLACEMEEFVFELYLAEAGDGDRTGVGFLVADLLGLREKLERAGYGPGAIGQNEWGRTFVVRDPDGRRVELKG